jgi:hypothetical protein
MNPDDQLDHRIEAIMHGQHPMGSPDPEIAEALQVAEVFARLNAVPVPTDLAERVLLRLGEAVDQRSKRGIIIPFPSTVTIRRAGRLKALAAVAACILVIIATTAGISNAAASSLPGDPLYSVKQWQQSFALAQAHNAADRAHIAIQNIRSGLSDLRTTVAHHSSDSNDITALNTVAVQTRDAQSAVNDISPGDTREARAAELGSLITEEEQTLHQLLGQVDWSVRAAFTGQLGALGESVPTITGAQVTEQHDLLILTITGHFFVAGTQVIFDNNTIPGAIVSQTSTQIVAQLDHSHSSGGHHTIGVVNPDGTVALWANSIDDGNGDHHDGDPTPSATDTSGGDHHNGTPSPSPTGGSDGGHSGGGTTTPTPSSNGNDKTPTPTETPHH